MNVKKNNYLSQNEIFVNFKINPRMAAIGLLNVVNLVLPPILLITIIYFIFLLRPRRMVLNMYFKSCSLRFLWFLGLHQ